MRDNWAIGFSQRYTVGVWVGNASGTSGAAPVWAALMNHLHQAEPSRPPLPPPGVVQGRVASSLKRRVTSGSSRAPNNRCLLLIQELPTHTGQARKA